MRASPRFGARFACASASLSALLLLAGCGGGGDAPTASFKPLSYDYLTKLRLNVGDVRIDSQLPPPGSSDLSAQAPTPPVDAMRRMAQDRIVAAGNAGTAVFTIDQASITGQPGGTLDGSLAAHLDIIGATGGHNGYAEAHVSRQFVPGTASDNSGLRSQLYDLTNQMMSDMNVELEYQVRRTLGDWLLDASGAPVGAAVEQQALPAAGPVSATPPAPAASSVGAPVQLAPTSLVPAAVPAPAPAPASPAPAAGVPPIGDPTAPGPTQLAPPPAAAAPAPAAAGAPAGAAPH